VGRRSKGSFSVLPPTAFRGLAGLPHDVVDLPAVAFSWCTLARRLVGTLAISSIELTKWLARRRTTEAPPQDRTELSYRNISYTTGTSVAHCEPTRCLAPNSCGRGGRVSALDWVQTTVSGSLLSVSLRRQSNDTVFFGLTDNITELTLPNTIRKAENSFTGRISESPSSQGGETCGRSRRKRPGSRINF